MHDDEKRWVIQSQQGNSDAFTNLVVKYQKQVFSVCYRILGTPTAAEDAAQEAFIRAYLAIDSYDINRSFATWVLSIASNYCIDQIRKRKSIILSMDNEKYAWMVPPSQEPTPERVLLDQEKQAQVHALLETLNETDRAAVVLQYWHDFSYNEIAETLSISVSAVKSRLFRARKTMAEEWQKETTLTPQPSHLPSERIAHESSTI
ncbi:MAG: sigma-70 family RNA polymerase sigma factor [Chloroflexota bacterium]|nr:sigma-70 family RNA polymerase sigma factor [Chloroflexota bacterium]